jgi:hypothetical protein
LAGRPAEIDRQNPQLPHPGSSDLLELVLAVLPLGVVAVTLLRQTFDPLTQGGTLFLGTAVFVAGAAVVGRWGLVFRMH